MVAPLLDAALIELEQQLAEEADLIWAGGFRYASFLDDARPLGLLMEDVGYRLLSAEVSLGIGARKGMIYMVLPAKGRGVSPSYASPALQEEASGAQSFTHNFAAQVEASSCILEAVLAQVSLPLAQVMALDVGAVVPLGRAAIDKLQLMGANGLTLTEGKLGQQRGMRAIRLSLPHAEAGFAAQVPDLDQDLAPATHVCSRPRGGGLSLWPAYGASRLIRLGFAPQAHPTARAKARGYSRNVPESRSNHR